jgi:hypothetical protein
MAVLHHFIWSIYDTKVNSFQNVTLAARAVFYAKFCCMSLQKQPFCDKIYINFLEQHWSQNGTFTHFYLFILWQKTKINFKKSLQLSLLELFLYVQFCRFLLQKKFFCKKIYISFQAKHGNSKWQLYTYYLIL